MSLASLHENLRMLNSSKKKLLDLITHKSQESTEAIKRRTILEEDYHAQLAIISDIATKHEKAAEQEMELTRKLSQLQSASLKLNQELESVASQISILESSVMDENNPVLGFLQDLDEDLKSSLLLPSPEKKRPDPTPTTTEEEEKQSSATPPTRFTSAETDFIRQLKFSSDSNNVDQMRQSLQAEFPRWNDVPESFLIEKLNRVKRKRVFEESLDNAGPPKTPKSPKPAKVKLEEAPALVLAAAAAAAPKEEEEEEEEEEGEEKKLLKQAAASAHGYVLHLPNLSEYKRAIRFGSFEINYVDATIASQVLHKGCLVLCVAPSDHGHFYLHGIFEATAGLKRNFQPELPSMLFSFPFKSVMRRKEPIRTHVPAGLVSGKELARLIELYSSTSEDVKRSNGTGETVKRVGSEYVKFDSFSAGAHLFQVCEVFSEAVEGSVWEGKAKEIAEIGVKSGCEETIVFHPVLGGRVAHIVFVARNKLSLDQASRLARTWFETEVQSVGAKQFNSNLGRRVY